MFILADIGGTKTRIAASRDLESFAEPIIFNTPTEYEALLDTVVARMRELAGTASIDAVCIGKPRWAQWSTFQEDMQAKAGVPLHFENDAALVGLGEAVHGAGRGVPICAYVTVSTGVNGARITNGAIDKTAIGFEIGGQYLSHAEMVSLEQLISGRAIEERFGAPPKTLGQDHAVWEELAQICAVGLHNTIVHWSPHRVVLGGSMFNHVGIQIDRVQYHLGHMMHKLPTLPEIVHSELGDIGGIYGAMAHLKQLR